MADLMFWGSLFQAEIAVLAPIEERLVAGIINRDDAAERTGVSDQVHWPGDTRIQQQSC